MWATWAERAADKAARRAQLSKVVRQWRNRALAKAFLPWLAEVMRTHDLQDLLASYLGKQVHCFESSLHCSGILLKLLLCSTYRCTSKGRASRTGSSGKARQGKRGAHPQRTDLKAISHNHVPVQRRRLATACCQCSVRVEPQPGGGVRRVWLQGPLWGTGGITAQQKPCLDGAKLQRNHRTRGSC